MCKVCASSLVPCLMSASRAACYMCASRKSKCTDRVPVGQWGGFAKRKFPSGYRAACAKGVPPPMAGVPKHVKRNDANTLSRRYGPVVPAKRSEPAIVPSLVKRQRHLVRVSPNSSYSHDVSLMLLPVLSHPLPSSYPSPSTVPRSTSLLPAW